MRRVAWCAVLAVEIGWMATMAASQVAVAVDAREASRRIVHSHMVFNVSRGPLTLLYPRWIPGEHGPNGPIDNIAGLRFRLGGTELPWRRDSVNMYAVHLDVPEGGPRLQADLDMLGNTTDTGFLLENSVTPMQLVIEWNQVVLYPERADPNTLQYQVSLNLPAGWKFGTALPIGSQTGDTVQFRPVSLYTLVDSPLIAGAKFRHVDITPAGETRQHFMEIAADNDASLDVPDEVISSYKRLVAEAGVLFGARHYTEYHFIVSIHGKYMNGLEHHQSSDNRLPDRGLVDPRWRRIHGALLPHEITHSWNGKYRRPAGLVSPNFDDPMKGDLLWVYEGLTNYLGNVLATRSGLWTAADFRDELATIAAELTHRPGRNWRPLEDTAMAAQVLYGSSYQWENWRRTVDYYDEGTLIWLEADTILRGKSSGTKSIDDFCKLFFGGESGSPRIVSYTFEDVVNTLSKMVPYDWRGFFGTRISRVAPHAPLGGVEASGWRLTYGPEPGQREHDQEEVEETYNMISSIGLSVKENGEIRDVIADRAAAKAGVAPGMMLIGVNWYKYSPDTLRAAIRTTAHSNMPIELLARNNESFVSLEMSYHEGEKFPRLERIEGAADVLQEITRPHASY